MKVTCPACKQAIPADQVNVQSDVAFCPRCEEVYSLARMVASGAEDVGELGEPPPGCWMNTGFDDWEVGATTRSYAALFLVPFMCVWSGFSLGGIYGSQIAEGKFDLTMSLFGLPFLIGTLIFGSIALMSVFGKAVLHVRGDEAVAFMGVGPIGWRQRFDWSKIERVEEGAYAMSSHNQNRPGLKLEGPETSVTFAVGVGEARKAFLLQALRKMLVTKSR